MNKDVACKLMKYILIPLILWSVFDYCDLLTAMGVHVNRINHELFASVINAAVLIGIFVATYMLIDHRQIQKDNNSSKIALLLLDHSYKNCKEVLWLVDNQDMLEKYIVPKIDFNKSEIDDPIIQNIKNGPFDDYGTIIGFSKDGFIKNDDLATYLNIRDRFRLYVSQRVILFDLGKYDNPEHIELRQKLISDKNEIYNMIDNEIDRIQRQLKEG